MEQYILQHIEILQNNSTTGNSRYEQKSFNAGFSSNNAEMCRMGIDAYYASK